MRINGLQPEHFWNHFLALTQIPRPSGNEDKVRQHIVAWAKQRGLEHQVDAAGNVVVRVPASKGMKPGPITVLQAHLDMVAEKNPDSQVDPNKEPLDVYRDGEYLRARGTTLGADNGIGIAAAMTAAEDENIRHGELELVFTYDEERGLTGAKRLDPKIVRGRRMLNLDSDIFGTFYVGCAGGEDTVLTLELRQKTTEAGLAPATLKVSGLKGGHSGVDIHCNRANAIKLLSLTLRQLMADCKARLVAVNGGSKRNAIPRDAEARLLVPKKQMAAAKEAVSKLATSFNREFSGIEEGISVQLLEEGEKAKKIFVSTDAERLIHLLLAIPSGVIAMSRDIPGMVETSTNLGVVSTDGREVEICNLKRSSVAEAIVTTRQTLHALAALCGAKTREENAYPGWKPEMKASLLTVSRDLFAELYSRPPAVTAIHAGLECGIIGEKFPGMEMISFGTEILDAHSPTERVNIAETEKCYQFLGRLLERLAQG